VDHSNPNPLTQIIQTVKKLMRRPKGYGRILDINNAKTIKGQIL